MPQPTCPLAIISLIFAITTAHLNDYNEGNHTFFTFVPYDRQ